MEYKVTLRGKPPKIVAIPVKVIRLGTLPLGMSEFDYRFSSRGEPRPAAFSAKLVPLWCHGIGRVCRKPAIGWPQTHCKADS
jgi:hypothetical protein